MFKRRRKFAAYRPVGRRHFSLSPETKRAILIVVLFTLAFLSLLSFFQAAGTAGELLKRALASAFGWGDWLVPALLIVLGYFLLRPATYEVKLVTYLGLIAIIAGFTGLSHLAVRNESLGSIVAGGSGGGYLGFVTGHYLYRVTALPGAVIILVALLLAGLFIFFNASFAGIVAVWQKVQAGIRRLLPSRSGDSYETLRDEATVNEDLSEVADDDDSEPQPAAVKEAKAPQPREHQPRRPSPPIDLPLDLLTPSTDTPSSGDVKLGMKKIEATLKSFGIEVAMGEVNVGPTVTQYTLKPTEGVKLTQITALQNDLALALAAHPIRIEAPIPGKSLVGIEVPNQSVSIVKLKDVLQSTSYQNRKSNLMLAVGKDVTGKVVMADLGKMPHLLIAGATGSGKSVSINSMIVSLLYQNAPDMLKLILIDPKRVELSVYNDIPHLITPVIIETDKTINALRWAVHQMDERYKLLAAAGKRNIESYNGARLIDTLPYIVIVIDELADLMAVAAKEVETAIIRLAQMARAVGIHLLLATQRPSVNVITGLIKANITSRIAFAVASQTDSRTIIDSSGAEKLLGNGDMLYMSAELTKPRRIQGAFISEKEVAAVTDYLRERGEPDYIAEVVERRHASPGVAGGFDSESEERDLRIAASVVVNARRASATLLQSRMRVGFAKASRLLDVLEERGIIGPQNSSKPREVLISGEELRRQYGVGDSGPEDSLDESSEQLDT